MVAGEISAADYANALLARVDEVEEQVQAWAHLDRAYLLAQASAADEAHAAGEPHGPLFGLPVGLKDIIDTADMPTEDGTVLHAGRLPGEDAALVQRLRAAGGARDGQDRDDRTGDLRAGQDTQSAQPRAHARRLVERFGGRGRRRHGAARRRHADQRLGNSPGIVLRRLRLQAECRADRPAPAYSRSRRHSTRSACSAARWRTWRCWPRHWPATTRSDASTRLRGRAAAACLRRVRTPPFPPTLAWVATPLWDRVAPDAQAAFVELVDLLAGRIAPFDLPASCGRRDRLAQDRDGSGYRRLVRGRIRARPRQACRLRCGPDRTRARRHRGRLPRSAGTRADPAARLRAGVRALRRARHAGHARHGAGRLGGHRRPGRCARCGPSSACPALSLPLLHGENGLPIGVQLVGRRGDDARLLRTARWLVQAAHHAA